ncbi:hypothetical protein DSC45_01350 [Streptomyces sp. YIM 130001]|uniref:DUF4429 domain-containing protein n=1 Tax=Streptomyces sp. YIM 130001 TaxID=2259644 RepID=UPI000E650E7D|nr:DUF4429 domain-containing protein [Streptomyces sp. YIM 130001]RII21036.1 hypothetical protein DSC45_01350 [Streptomyces sp. YIM 130001]
MAEIIQRDGTWVFDGTLLRITPGLHRSVPLLRQAYGAIEVPLEAMAGISFAPERRTGWLRIQLRDGADPLLQATGGRLPGPTDPYRLAVDTSHGAVAEYIADEVRRALLLEQVPDGPTAGYLLPGPAVPVSVRCSDGTVSFDGQRIRIDWSNTSDRIKRVTGPRIFGLDALTGVEWLPNTGTEEGCLRFLTTHAAFSELPPEKDPYALDLWGNPRKDMLAVLVAAAVTSRLPHPWGRSRSGSGADDGAAAGRDRRGRPEVADHDAVLRRLREAGALHREGVLDEAEFTLVKRAVLRGFEDPPGG